MKQLELFGINEKQDEYISQTWGALNFFPTKGNSYKETCQKCLLLHTFNDEIEPTECDLAPCQAIDRLDGQNGYFSIHQMPSF